jgi:integrase
MTLTTILEEQYAPLRGIDPRTIEIYGYTLKAWGQFLGHEPTLDDLSDELMIARFLAHRLTIRSVGTAAKDRSQIRALAEFCYRRGLLKAWPQIRTIRVPERVPQAWLTDEFVRLLAACDGEPGEVAGVPARLWWRAALLTCYEIGERIGGILGIEWRDVSAHGILVRAEERKGKRRDIFRSISPECHAAIEAIRTDRKIVFDWDRCYTSLWGRLGKICERAGLPNDRASKFHRIRKTTASYAAAAGLDPQAVMDHASPLTTQRYLDPRIVRPKDVHAALPKVSYNPAASTNAAS